MVCIMDLKSLLNYIGKTDNPRILAKEFASNVYVSSRMIIGDITCICRAQSLHA